MSPGRRRWRRVRRWLLTAVASVLVFAAGLLALGRLAMPWLVESPDRVALWLSERIGRSVAIDEVQAHWTGRGPILELQGLHIAGAEGEPAAISLGRARVQIDLYAWLLPNRHLISDFLLVDADVGLVREPSGLIALEGFGASSTEIRESGLGSWLARVGHLGLSGGRLSLTDQASGRVFELARVEMRVSQRGDRLLIGVEHQSASDPDARLRAVVDLQGPLQWPPQEAQVYVEAEDFPIADLDFALQTLDIDLTRGNLQGQQWGSWRNGRIDSVRGEWKVKNLVVAAPKFDWLDSGNVVPNLHLPHAQISLDGVANAQGFTLQMEAVTEDGARDGSRLTVERSDVSAKSSWRYAGERVPLSLLTAIVQLAKPVDQATRAQVYAAQPTGLLESFSGQLDTGQWQVHGQLRDLSMRPAAARLPEFSGVDAQFAADAQGATLFIDDSSVQFGIPGVLADRVELTQVRARIGVHRAPSGWQFELVDSQLAGEGFSAQLAANLDLDRVIGTQLQFAAYVPEANIEAAKQFWVLNKMPPRTISWLNRALIGGRVRDGTLQFRGPLSDWPFLKDEGRFEARFAIDDTTLDFNPDWPRAEQLHAEVAFINTSMVIDSATGGLLGNKVIRGRGAIPSMKDPVLDLDLAGEGDGAGWLKFLQASPVQRTHAEVLAGMALTGAVDVSAKIHLPLRKDLGTNRVDGEALLKAVHYTDSKWGLDFTDVHGRIDFSQSGFSADQLRLKLAGEPGELSLAIGDFTSDASRQVEAELRGRASAQTLFGQYEQMAAILSQINGVSAWKVNVEVPKAEAGQVALTSIVYASDLRGVGIGFPAPLGKPIESAKALTLSVQLPIESAPPLKLKIGDDVHLFARVGTRDRDFSGQLQFGDEAPMDLPTKGLRVTGKVDSLDPTPWTGWIFNSAAGADEGSILADIALDIGAGADASSFKLQRAAAPAIATTPLTPNTAQPAPTTGRPWLIQLTGPQAQGNIRFEAGVGRPSAVVAHFDHLYLPEPSGGAARAMSLTPDLIPTLHLWVGDLRIGAASIGEARLEAFSTDTGLRVDLLEARSKDLEIYAKGDWITSAGGAKSRFDIRMTSEDLGRMLTGLGFDGVIEGGQTLARIEASWDGAPFDFALERLTGSIEISVGRGRFLDVNPGAGRIFGLLSLRELPRRLTLDFRDLFQSGMSFDRIEGRFVLADGNAWTENLTVRGPAADILIIGRTGLASRDYDQQVMVAPHMSRVLPVLGGLAAGPVGAAAGFLAQGMVSKNEDIEKSSRVHYSVAGSWEKPVVARLTPIREDASPRRRQNPTEVIRPG